MKLSSVPKVGFSRLLEYPLRWHRDKTALIDTAEDITFGEAEARANRLANSFLEKGAKRGDRVAIILPNSIAFIIAEMAVLKCGMVKVPLNFRFHPKEVLYSLGDCAPSLVVCDPSYAESILKDQDSIPTLLGIYVVGEKWEQCINFDEVVRSGDSSFVQVDYEENAPILIRYTGGTTGRPKGIVHTEQSLLNVHLDLIREVGIHSKDVALMLGHLSHGNNFVWAALYGVGATQIIREQFEPEQVLQDIAQHKVTFTYMVPTMLQRLLDEDDGMADVSSLRCFWITSAPASVPLMRKAHDRFGQIFISAYTLSECPVITTILRPYELLEKDTSVGSRLGSCGKELITVELRLLDDKEQEVAEGEVGEIAVRSPSNMAGYLGLPKETKETMRGEWVLTGDMARRDEEGYLYIVDRKKEVIITGALNVYPKEVEDVLVQHPAVRQAAVVGVSDEEWGERIKAFIVLEEGETTTEDELVELCRDNLASYKKPREVEFIEELPLSPIGKISRRTLKEQEEKKVTNKKG